MKRLIIILIGVFTTINTYSQYITPSHISMNQYQVLDSAYLKISYKFTFVEDTLKSKETQKEDIQTLLIGDKISKYFSHRFLEYNKHVETLLKQGVDAIPNAPDGICGYEIYKNYPDRKMTMIDFVWNSLGGNYIYIDEMKNIKWEVTNEQQIILSYPCLKATTKFRGRTYEAWFTLNIPVDNGPWKFGGLPGLIMKLSDSKNYFIFECIGLENLTEKTAIKYYNLDYTKITRQNLDKLYRRHHTDQAAYNLSRGVRTMIMNPNTHKGTVIKNSATSLPYNPIEIK